MCLILCLYVKGALWKLLSAIGYKNIFCLSKQLLVSVWRAFALYIWSFEKHCRNDPTTCSHDTNEKEDQLGVSDLGDVPTRKWNQEKCTEWSISAAVTLIMSLVPEANHNGCNSSPGAPESLKSHRWCLINTGMTGGYCLQLGLPLLFSDSVYVICL